METEPPGPVPALGLERGFQRPWLWAGQPVQPGPPEGRSALITSRLAFLGVLRGRTLYAAKSIGTSTPN